MARRRGRRPPTAAMQAVKTCARGVRDMAFHKIRDMAFHKKSGLRIEDMVRSRWVYRKLRNFRAGIEAGISCLNRTLARSPGASLSTLRATSGPRWSPAISPSSPVSGRPDAGHRAAFRNTPRAPADAPRPYRRQIALRPQPASPVQSRLPKKDRFSKQNTSKNLKNRRLRTGTSLVQAGPSKAAATVGLPPTGTSAAISRIASPAGAGER